MPIKFPAKTNLVLIGAVIGLFIGVTIQQATGQTGATTASGGSCENAICVPAGSSAQWRAGNLILNTSNQYANGLLVPYGNVGIGTITPTAKLEVVGKIKSSQGFCINDVCVTKWDDLKTMLGTGTGTGTSTGTGTGTGTGTVDPFPLAKTFSSASANGPWTNNPVCNTGNVYSRTTGVSRTSPPKGCASPAGSTKCLSLAEHREFTPSEWINGTTIQTVVKGADFPVGDYDLYLSKEANIKKVGTLSLKTCGTGGTGGTGGATYNWACGFVVGPSSPILTGYTCGASNVNQTINVPTTNGGNVDCTCKAQ